MLKSRFWLTVKFLSTKLWFWSLLFGLVLFSFLYVREQKRVLQEYPTNWTHSQTADCAVVLTGGPGRVREGFDLLARQEVKRLIVTGVHPQSQLREVIPMWPFYGNLDEKNIVFERRSATTYGNAQQTLPLVETLRCRDIILITSRLHMYRSLRTFKAAFPETIVIQPRAVVVGRVEQEPMETMIEVSKSLFYSLWAY